jgi:hypothetical protein
MGWFSSDKCDICGGEVHKGIKCKRCNTWMCGNCLANRATRISHTFGRDSIACLKCGKDTGCGFDPVMQQLR